MDAALAALDADVPVNYGICPSCLEVRLSALDGTRVAAGR